MLDRVAADHAARPMPDTPYWRRIRRGRERQARAIAIMRLAARGWSNAAIGAKVTLSASQVSRIIRDQLKRKV